MTIEEITDRLEERSNLKMFFVEAMAVTSEQIRECLKEFNMKAKERKSCSY